MSLGLGLELVSRCEQGILPRLQLGESLILLFELSLQGLLLLGIVQFRLRVELCSVVEFGLVEVDGAEICDALLEGFVLVFQRHGTAV